MFITDLTDECGLGTHNCDVNALCINNNVSFSCECLSGYNGTGTVGTCSGNMNTLRVCNSLVAVHNKQLVISAHKLE